MPSSAPSKLKGKQILVTGSAGFLGQHLIRRLIREGAQITSWDRESLGQTQAVDLNNASHIRRRLMQLSPEIVYHLAGRVDLARTPEMTALCIEENIAATANLLWGLSGLAVSAVVFPSTTEVYGDGQIPFDESQSVQAPSPYAVSKIAAEELCRFFMRVFQMPIVIVRLSTIYGPGQSQARFIPSLIKAASTNAVFPMTSGLQRRDFLYVEDAVEGLIRAAAIPLARGETINLGGASAVSLREVVEEIRRILKTDWQPRYGDLPQRAGERQEWLCKLDKAKNLLGWQPPTLLSEGLRKAVAFYTADTKPKLRRRKAKPAALSV